jgi:hypothetical protein
LRQQQEPVPLREQVPQLARALPQEPERVPLQAWVPVPAHKQVPMPMWWFRQELQLLHRKFCLQE